MFQGNGTNKYYVIVRDRYNSTNINKFYLFADDQRGADMLAQQMFGSQFLITPNAIFEGRAR